jgi:hypothetical protein
VVALTALAIVERVERRFPNATHEIWARSAQVTIGKRVMERDCKNETATISHLAKVIIANLSFLAKTRLKQRLAGIRPPWHASCGTFMSAYRRTEQ